jgi:antitoxin ParD1/3/4
MDVRLTPEHERFVNEQVESGKYFAPVEVVREALDLLQEEVESDARRLERLKAEIQVGLDQLDAGLGIPADEALKMLRQRIEARRAKSA